MPDYSVADVRRILADLRETIRADLQPIIDLGRTVPRVGMFTIPREVFAYVDFLGALYEGYRGEVDRAGRRQIATTAKAIAFIETFFSRIDPLYARYGRLLHEMVRHGTVHVYRPNALRRGDGVTIEWLLYKGERKNAPVHYRSESRSVSHMEPIR